MRKLFHARSKEGTLITWTKGSFVGAALAAKNAAKAAPTKCKRLSQPMILAFWHRIQNY